VTPRAGAREPAVNAGADPAGDCVGWFRSVLMVAAAAGKINRHSMTAEAPIVRIHLAVIKNGDMTGLLDTRKRRTKRIVRRQNKSIHAGRR
jgi:hypothetical protein